MFTSSVMLLVAHFMGDFLLRSDWMALHKSWDALAIDCFVYSLCFAYLGPSFVAVTFLTHFVTDAITSRFIPVGRAHLRFVTIGFDQLIHVLTLMGTFTYLFG